MARIAVAVVAVLVLGWLGVMERDQRLVRERREGRGARAHPGERRAGRAGVP